MARQRMLPTVVASDSETGAWSDWENGRNGRGARLVDVMLYPTATAGDAKASGSRCTAGSDAHPGTSLTDAVVRGTNRGNARASGHLSPRFVEWMMGLPPNWTRHVCDPLETPLFRSARKSSAKSSAC